MRLFIKLIVLLLLITSCTKDCGESLGDTVRQEVEVSLFDKIIVNSGISLYIKQGDIQSVIIETGSNRLDNVYVEVLDNTLSVQADDLCLLSSSFEPVKIFITSPTITRIRNSSQFAVYSEGVLEFPRLTLVSENYNNDFLNIGDFNLDINNQYVEIVSNGLSNFTISGNTDELKLLYFNGLGIFKGKDLIANDVIILHRAENTLFVNPSQSITGDIYSIGDVIAVNHPDIIDIEEHYEGRLIFE